MQVSASDINHNTKTVTAKYSYTAKDKIAPVISYESIQLKENNDNSAYQEAVVRVTSLVRAMGEFEGNSAEFVYHPVTGTKEISALSDSFEHMAVRIQKLMEEVRLGKKKL